MAKTLADDVCHKKNNHESFKEDLNDLFPPYQDAITLNCDLSYVLETFSSLLSFLFL